MRVGIGQIDSWVGAFDRNVEAIVERTGEAKASDCRLVVFPELAVCGARFGDLIRRPGFVESCQAALERICRASDGIAVVVGSVARDGDVLRDSAFVIDDGSIVARIDAAHVGADDAGRNRLTPRGGTEPVEVGDRRIGILLGEAIGPEDQPIDVLESLGASFVVQIAASRFRIGGDRVRRRAAAVCAREVGLPILFVNAVGGIDDIVFDGASFLVNRDGRLAFHAPGFADGLHVVDIDRAGPIDEPDSDDLAEIRAAIVRGVRDYVRKNGFSEVIVGLSGGIDSSLVAALAVDALGPNAVTGVYLPTVHSSDVSATNARSLASALGIDLLEVSATETHTALRGALPFEARGAVDENLQARARAALWMALANERNALVLATGNKSEIAVGYSTLYGDTTGALAPIADLYKTDVYRLAGSLRDRIPRAILERPPSAELRPDQRDEDDLPPYGTLDPLLRALIEENASRDDLIERGFDRKLVDEIVGRFHGAEFKRAQLPPGVALSDRPLGCRRVPLTHAWRG